MAVKKDIRVKIADNVYERTHCLDSLMAKNARGHAMVKVGDKTLTHHKEQWLIWRKNEIIPEGHILHHKCHRKQCINVLHLEVLPNDVHCRLHQIGEKNNSAKLNKRKVKQIRKYYESGALGLKTLSEMYEVTKPCIWNIIAYKSWVKI